MISKKMTTGIITALALYGLSSVALAGTIDFVEAAKDNEGGVEGESFGGGSITVTVTSTSTSEFGSEAYLDDVTGPDDRPAGLGVCSSGLNIDDGECSVSSDDNVSGNPDEALILTFNQVVTITQLMFRDLGHYNDQWNDGDAFELSIDGVPLDNPIELVGVWTGAITGTVFVFSYYNANFYISSVTAAAVVPEPGTLALFGLGLLGAGVARRRTRSRISF